MSDVCSLCKGAGTLLTDVCPLCDADPFWPFSKEELQAAGALSRKAPEVLLANRLKRDERQIWAIHDGDFVRVYQAYNDAIADAAVEANSFRGAMEKGLWSSTRMTWIKPSAVWMAYRCGWTCLKDKNQARVLALDLSRKRFEALLMSARLSHAVGEVGACKTSPVVVQWDPERVMSKSAINTQVFTASHPSARSIQIGLRNEGVQALLDPEFVLRIVDVTAQFRRALSVLQSPGGSEEAAAAALWPEDVETCMSVPGELHAHIKMS